MLDRFNAGAVLAELSGESGDAPCSVFMAVPTMYAKLLDLLSVAQRDFGHARLLTSGSAALLVGEFESIERHFGLKPVEREGMSETGMNFSNPVSGLQKPGSIGLPLPGVSVRIVDVQTGRDVEPGAVGELWLKSPSITPGYWRKPEETRAAFDNGWFKTGDLGKVDAGGYYYLTDRIKHIIITGSKNPFRERNLGPAQKRRPNEDDHRAVQNKDDRIDQNDQSRRTHCHIRKGATMTNNTGENIRS